MVQIKGPAVLILLPVAAHRSDGFRHLFAVVDEIAVEGAERCGAEEVAELHPLLEAAFLHIALIEGGIGALRDGPEEGQFHIQAVLVAGVD